MSSTQTLSGLTINVVDSNSTYQALVSQGDVTNNELWLVQGTGSSTLADYGITNAYTKAEIDALVGNIETLLAGI